MAPRTARPWADAQSPSFDQPRTLAGAKRAKGVRVAYLYEVFTFKRFQQNLTVVLVLNVIVSQITDRKLGQYFYFTSMIPVTITQKKTSIRFSGFRGQLLLIFQSCLTINITFFQQFYSFSLLFLPVSTLFKKYGSRGRVKLTRDAHKQNCFGIASEASQKMTVSRLTEYFQDGFV